MGKVALFVGTMLVLLPQERPVPVPDADAQRKAEKVVHEVFGTDYVKKPAAERITFSRKMLQQAMEIAEQVKPLERRIFDARRAGDIKADDYPSQIDEAEQKGILTPAEAEAVRAFDQRVLDVTGVDDFDPNELRRQGA